MNALIPIDDKIAKIEQEANKFFTSKKCQNNNNNLTNQNLSHSEIQYVNQNNNNDSTYQNGPHSVNQLINQFNNNSKNQNVSHSEIQYVNNNQTCPNISNPPNETINHNNNPTIPQLFCEKCIPQNLVAIPKCELNKLKEQIISYQADNELLNNGYNNFKRENEILVFNLNESNNEVRKEKRNVEKYKLEYEISIINFNKLNIDNGKLTTDLNQFKNQNERLKNDLADNTAQFITDKEKLASDLNGSKDQLLKEITTANRYKSDVDRLTKEITEAKNNSVKLETELKKEKAALESKINQLNDNNKELLKKEKLNYEKHKLEVDRLTKELATTKKDSVKLETELKKEKEKINKLNNKQTSSWNEKEKELQNTIGKLNDVMNLNEDLKIIIRNLENKKSNNEKEYKTIIDSLNEDNRMVQCSLKKEKDELEGYKVAISKLNSSLNEKEIIIQKVNENLRKEMERVAEKASVNSLENKSKESQLNNQLPMAKDVSSCVDMFIHTMDEYFMNTEYLETIINHELASLLNIILKSSYEQCLIKFNYILKHLLGSRIPNSNQLFNIRCLVYSSIDHIINETSQSAINNLSETLNKIHNTDQRLEIGKRFIYDCCKFIWTVLLSQPEVRFDNNEFREPSELILYSKDNHIAFGKLIEGELCVQLTIIPSIYLVRDNSLLSKSYVLLKPIEKQNNDLPKGNLPIHVTTPATIVNSYDSKEGQYECIKDNLEKMKIETVKDHLKVYTDSQPAYSHPPATNFNHPSINNSSQHSNFNHLVQYGDKYYYGNQIPTSSSNIHSIYPNSLP